MPNVIPTVEIYFCVVHPREFRCAPGTQIGQWPVAKYRLTIEAIERHEGAILVLLPKGRIEAPDIEEFEDPIHERIVEGDLNIIIDFSDVEAIDPAGIRALLTIAARLVVKHGRLVLCGISNHLGALLRVTAFDQVVEIVDSYEDAVQSFR